MADGLKEALSKYVPAAVLDEAVEAVKTTEISPEWYRNDIAKVGARAKQADDFESRLNSIEAEPKKVEAYKRVGLLPQDATDLSGLKPYQKDWLDRNVAVEDLDDLNKVASKVQEGGFEVSLSEQQPGEPSGAQEIVSFTSDAGTGAPVRTGQQAAQEAFDRDMDAVPDGDKNKLAEVLAKHGMLPATEG